MERRKRQKRRAVGGTGPTLEVVLYVLIVVAAGLLRFAALGWIPLRESEAAQALAAWRFVQGQGEVGVAYSPLLFTLNFVHFALFGASDAAARFAPALFGTLLVALPYFLRRWLGRAGALTAAGLLAVSPTALFFSRSLSGPVVVAACALGVVAGLFGYVDERRPGYVYGATVALALALAASPAAYTVLLAVAVFLALAVVADLGPGRDEVAGAWQAARDEPGLLRNAGLLFVGVWGLAGTGFLLNPGGLQAGVNLLARWLTGFLPAGGRPWYVYGALLALYEPLVLLFGLLGLGSMAVRWGVRGQRPSAFDTFLMCWLAVALVVTAVAGQRPAGNVLLSVVPLALLAAGFIGRLLTTLGEAESRTEVALFAAIALIVCVHLYLQLSDYTLNPRFAPVTWIAVGIALLISLFVLAWIWSGPALAQRGAAVCLLLALGLWTARTGWHLNFSALGQPAEPLASPASSPQVRTLVSTLERVSSARETDQHIIAVTVEESTGPVVAWYLRDFAHVQYVSGSSQPFVTPVFITPASETEPPASGGYAGQAFDLETAWQSESLWGAEWLRWLLFREFPQPLSSDKVVLWVRQD